MIKHLFLKYLQGNCTKEEFNRLLPWFKNDSQSKAGKEIVQDIWNEFNPDDETLDRNRYNQILDRIHHRININTKIRQSGSGKKILSQRIIVTLTKVAAVLLLPVLIWFLYTSIPETYIANTSPIEVKAPAGGRIQIQLGDGTKVWLNSESKLTYPYRFDSNKRKVFLSGEAFFEVTHNAEIPFVVETEYVDVKVTGTKFNVNAYSEDSVVETTLVEGKVFLYEKEHKQKIKELFPDESLTFSPYKNSFSVETGTVKKYTAWKDGLLVFKNDPIQKVAIKLERWYNIDVVFTNEKAKEFTYTATFADETLSQLLDLMTLATPITYELTPREKLPDGSFSRQKLLIGFRNK